MSTLGVNDIATINRQSDVISRNLRENFANIKSANNDIQNQIDTLNAYSGSSSTEVVNARQYATDLRERISESDKLLGNYVINGLTVEEQSTPNMTVNIKSGNAIINGVYNILSTDTDSPTLIAPTNERYDLIVLNSDNTLTIVSGNDSNDPDLPAIGLSQRPVALIKLDSTTTQIFNVNIIDIRLQGVILDNRDWYFSIEDAMDDVNDVTGGALDIYAGEYYEEIDVTNKNNLTINMSQNANIYRLDDSSHCLVCSNTIPSQSGNVVINGGNFLGVNKAGAIELININFIDGIIINSTKIGTNASSTATYKDMVFTNSNKIQISTISDGGLSQSNFSSSSDYNIKINGDSLTDSTIYNDGDTGKSFLLKGVTDKVSVNSTGSTIFSTMDKYIPNNGDEIIVNGAFRDATSGVEYIVSRAIRATSTNITFYVYTIGTTSVVTSLSISSTNSTVYRISIAW